MKLKLFLVAILSVFLTVSGQAVFVFVGVNYGLFNAGISNELVKSVNLTGKSTKDVLKELDAKQTEIENKKPVISVEAVVSVPKTAAEKIQSVIEKYEAVSKKTVFTEEDKIQSPDDIIDAAKEIAEGVRKNNAAINAYLNREYSDKVESVKICMADKMKDIDYVWGRKFELGVLAMPTATDELTMSKDIYSKYAVLFDYLDRYRNNRGTEIMKTCSAGLLKSEVAMLSVKKYDESSANLFEPFTDTDEFRYISDFFYEEDWDDVKLAAKDAGVQPEEIMSVISVEQLRASNSYRAFFKRIMATNALQSFTNFSYGIGGMKEPTAKFIEASIKNKDSKFYPGDEFANLLDVKPGEDPDTVRTARLTDPKSYYWQYLYAGIAIRMIETQWAKEGYPIGGRMDIVATLYNLGFGKSVPKAEPKVGGAPIKIGDGTWSFGTVAENAYVSFILRTAIK